MQGGRLPLQGPGVPPCQGPRINSAPRKSWLRKLAQHFSRIEGRRWNLDRYPLFASDCGVHRTQWLWTHRSRYIFVACPSGVSPNEGTQKDQPSTLACWACVWCPLTPDSAKGPGSSVMSHGILLPSNNAISDEKPMIEGNEVSLGYPRFGSNNCHMRGQRDWKATQPLKY
jgi:hypothetical protein